MVDANDSDIIRRCRNRDTDAFRILVERHRKSAYGFAFSYLKNRDDALGVSQEAFVRAWNAMDSFDETRPFRPWLFSIVKNLSINLLARKKRLREVSLEEAMDESGFDVASTEADPLETLAEKEKRGQVWRAIMSLGEDFREIIILKHFEDLSYREIARALKIPGGTVMSRLYYARLALRDALAGEIERS